MQVRNDKAKSIVEVIDSMKQSLVSTMDQKIESDMKWSYTAALEHPVRAVSIECMRYFIESEIDTFISMLKEVFPFFTTADSESVGTAAPTPLAVKFMAIFEYLEEKGFPGPGHFNLPLNFWSGEEACQRALSSLTDLTDSKVANVSVLFDVCRLIQKGQGRYDDYITLMTTSVSRVYAAHARETANVYLSTNKLSESAGITVANNFWLGELPTLMNLKHRGLLNDIIIHLYDHHRGEWDSGISLFSDEGARIHIYRRSMHRFDDPAVSPSFKSLNMSQEDKDRWIHSKSRPAITFGRMREFAGMWRMKVHQRRLIKADEVKGEVYKRGSFEK